MVNRIWLALVASALVGTGSVASAQQRPIGGRVISAVTGQPVNGASVAVIGTPIVVVTDQRGEYSLSAPGGPVTLLVRGIGFKRRTIEVAADQSQADVTLDQDIFNLEAVVITGQATAVEQRNLAQAVSTVPAQELARAPTPTIESALQGKIAGAIIQQNSGAPGGGAQISLRGVNTINAPADPLIVVDGIVVSNAAIANNMNSISQAGAAGNASNQDNPVNRIADLNPADIERVEILKGASAAAIYGSQASNGVVVITTRRGVSGAPRFHLTQRLGEFRVGHLLRSRVFADSADAVTFTSDTALVSQQCNIGPNNACPNFDNIGAVWDNHSLSSETDVSINGGTDQTRYFVSGLVKRDGGIAPNTFYQKQALRANLDQVLGARWSLAVSSQVIHSLSSRGISNNDNAGVSPYMVFPLTPSFVDLRPVNGIFPDNPFERSNPLQTYALLENLEDVWRTLGAATLRWEALSTERQNLRLVATGGLDYFQQQNNIYSPPELEYEPNDTRPGTAVLGKNANLNLNFQFNAIHTLVSGSGVRATTSGGFQYVDRDLDLLNIVGEDLPSGQRSVNQATRITTIPFRQLQKDLGLFAQEEVIAMEERLALTLGFRADRSSRNGDTRKLFFYPKVSGSYRLTDLGGNVGDEVKLRAAFGQSGTQPQFGHKFVANASGTLGGLFGSFASPGIIAGDPNITPERQTEIEGGFDATLRGGRFNASVTFFNKTITDLILVQTPAPTTGQGARVFNGGKLRNSGIEIAAGYAIAQRPELTWIARTTFFANRAKVVDLPVPAFQVGGFGTALGVFQIEQGKSPTQILGPEGAVGDANPDFQMSFASDLDYKRWSFGMLWDWKKGGDVINLTELLFDLFGNAEDVAASQARAALFGTAAKQWVQDASYLKLREVSLAYHLPTSVTSQLFGSLVRDARVSFAGRNLIRVTKFRGIDPEVSNFGNQAIARNIDVAPFPPTRSFFLSIDLDF